MFYREVASPNILFSPNTRKTNSKSIKQIQLQFIHYYYFEINIIFSLSLFDFTIQKLNKKDKLTNLYISNTTFVFKNYFYGPKLAVC